MSDYIIFGNVDSRNYGVSIFDAGTDNVPARVYERYEVAGRSGDLLVDQKRFENVQMTYWGVIYENFEENLRNFRAAMRSQIGYQRLEDSIHPDEYYDACFIEAMEVQIDKARQMGKFQIIFDRKPQRWLTAGEEVTELTATGTIENPTLFDSNPLLRAYGTGKMYLGDYSIEIKSADGYTDIDCFLQEAYKGLVSKNANVEFGSTGKPVLKAGVNNIQLPNTITKLEITPRWYTI